MADMNSTSDTKGVASRSPLFSWQPRRRAAAVCTTLLLGLTSPVGTMAEPIRIAVALPLSGPHSAIGHDVKAAVELAVADYRTRTGPADHDVELSWHDDACSSDGGESVAKRITADPPAQPYAVIGHACPSAAEAAAPIYGAAGVAFITAGTLPARVASQLRFGTRHFRVPGGGTQGALIGAALIDAGNGARIAFVRDRTQLSQSDLQPAAAMLAAHGRIILTVETFPGAEKDFAPIAQRLKTANITHVAVAAFPSEAVLLVAELRKANPSLIIFATDQLADPSFALASGGMADGVQVALAPSAGMYPRARTVAQRLQDGGSVPSRTALSSYAAVEIVTGLANTHALADGAFPLEAMTADTFDTILGPIRFGATGAADLPSHVFYTWKDGKLQPPPG